MGETERRSGGGKPPTLTQRAIQWVDDELDPVEQNMGFRVGLGLVALAAVGAVAWMFLKAFSWAPMMVFGGIAFSGAFVAFPKRAFRLLDALNLPWLRGKDRRA